MTGSANSPCRIPRRARGGSQSDRTTQSGKNPVMANSLVNHVGVIEIKGASN